MAAPAPAAVPAVAPVPQLSVVEAKAALTDAIAAFELPENEERMRAAIASANGDPVMLMTQVMPVGMDIQAQVLSRYGFEATQPAVMAATMQMQMLSLQDPELAAMLAQLKAKFMPQPGAAAPVAAAVPGGADDAMD